ncbi:hypothetical protein [Shimazuella kribbensis]|uniref:hypothetical protein n=1 Tax=Shimazuella kribbensis TaxID=139808 RepID=UPI000490BFFA|nr:hypothetical protein [Shimazuella kribbensis]
MISKKSLGLGSIALAVALFTSGCSMPSYVGPVLPAEDQQGVIAAWENKAATVKCTKNEFAATWKDKGREYQECYKPSRKSKQKAVLDLDLLLNEKYQCTGNNGMEFLAYVKGSKDQLVFCFYHKRDSQKPNPKDFK